VHGNRVRWRENRKKREQIKKEKEEKRERYHEYFTFFNDQEKPLLNMFLTRESGAKIIASSEKVITELFLLDLTPNRPFKEL